MEYENVILEKEGTVAILTVNRPAKYNALNTATRREIADVINTIKSDLSVSVLVITGSGEKAFIAGTDLTEFGKMSPLEVFEFCNTYGQRLYTSLEELPIPVIAMINGYAFGGGLEISMACDFRFASDNARLGQPEINLGFIPSGGGTQRLSRLVGSGLARQMLFTGDAISAQEAYRIGLVNAVFPPDQLRDAVMKVANRIARRGRTSLMMCKRAALLSQEVGLTPGLAYETLCQVACFTHPDRAEGVQAFFEKREPDFHKKF